MPSSMSKTEIANRALLLIGETQILDIDDASDPTARKVKVFFQSTLEAELETTVWYFARKRAILAADAETPDFEFTYQFTLPNDFLRLIGPENPTDWLLEGDKILTNDGNTIKVTYIARPKTVAEHTALFNSALAGRLAMELCESKTASNSKYARAQDYYKTAKSDARLANAIQKVPLEPYEDTWISARR